MGGKAQTRRKERRGSRSKGGQAVRLGISGCAGLCLLLEACAPPPPPKPDPAPLARALLARRLDDPTLLAFIEASSRLLGAEARPPPWRLSSLTLAALYYHPDLALARSRLAEAKAAVTTATALPNPNLTFVPPPLVFGAVVSAVLETGGRRTERRRAAEAREAALRADLAAAAAQVASRVRSAAIAYWYAERAETLSAARARLTAALSDAMHARLAAGALSAPDYERSRIEALHAAATARQASEAALEAKAALAQAIGIPPSALDVPLAFETFDAPPPLSPTPALSEALARRPDIQAAAARLEMAEDEIDLARTGRIPNLALEPGYNWYQGIPAYGVAPSFDLPLLDQHAGPIAEAEARRDQAAAELFALAARLAGESESASARLFGLRAAWEQAREAAAESRAHLAALEHAAQLGGVDTPSLLEARLGALTAEEDVLTQQKSLLEAMSSLADTFTLPLFTPGLILPDPESAPHAALSRAAAP